MDGNRRLAACQLLLKTELATKVVNLQQGPELDRLVTQLAGSAAQDLIAKWGPQLESKVPKAKQQKASEDLNAELNKYAEDAKQLIAKRVSKVSADALVPAYGRAHRIRGTVDHAGDPFDRLTLRKLFQSMGVSCKAM